MMNEIEQIVSALQVFLAETEGPLPVAKPIRCNDGVEISVQASKYHYCSPKDSTGPWTHVEVMMDVDDIRVLDLPHYGDPIGYAPIEEVAQEILAHGYLMLGNGNGDRL
jgi:hypothetical protein